MMVRMIPGKRVFLGIGFLFGPLLWLILWSLNLSFAQGAPCHANYTGWCESISSIIDFCGPFLVVFIGLFIFSLITYFLPDRVFRLWSRFALVWIPLSMIAIAVSPEYGGGWSGLYPVEKGTVAFAMSAVFVAVSALIVVGVWLFAGRSHA